MKMKRFISILVASVLMSLTFSTVASAATVSKTTDLYVSYNLQEGKAETLSTTYSVYISKDSLQFWFTKTPVQTWDKEKFEVVDSIKYTVNTTTHDIKITNNSAIGVKVEVAYSEYAASPIHCTLSGTTSASLQPKSYTDENTMTATLTLNSYDMSEVEIMGSQSLKSGGKVTITLS